MISFAGCLILSVVSLDAIMLGASKLSLIMLNVVTQSVIILSAVLIRMSRCCVLIGQMSLC